MTSGTGRLELSDPGWLRIDEAALRVSGPVDAIVKEMETVLSDNAVQALCERLGIASTGFLFLDPHRGPDGPVTFFSPNEPIPKTYRTQYRWRSVNLAAPWSDLVHALFVHVRSNQAREVELTRKRSEDYFRHIPKDQSLGLCLSDEDREFRSVFQAHYVTLGETLFTLMAWRYLCLWVDHAGGAASIEPRLAFTQVSPATRHCYCGGVDVLDVLAGGDRRRFYEAWRQISDATPTVKEEFDVLGLGEGDPAWSALAKFTAKAGLIDDAAGMSGPERCLAIQSSIPQFLGLLGAESVTNAAEALVALERYARLPIVPFYVWHALDRAPKCYLVVPVWTSQEYGVVVDDIRCRHLGLALSAVEPLKKIDWTLSADDREGSAASSDADPSVIVNAIRVMAKPLVEGHLYGVFIRLLSARQEELEQQARMAVDRSWSGLEDES